MWINPISIRMWAIWEIFSFAQAGYVGNLWLIYINDGRMAMRGYEGIYLVS